MYQQLEQRPQYLRNKSHNWTLLGELLEVTNCDLEQGENDGDDYEEPCNNEEVHVIEYQDEDV